MKHSDLNLEYVNLADLANLDCKYVERDSNKT